MVAMWDLADTTIAQQVNASDPSSVVVGYYGAEAYARHGTRRSQNYEFALPTGCCVIPCQLAKIVEGKRVRAL